MLTVTKKFTFSYAHHLPEYDGDCANMHGHNSDVEVEFKKHKLMPPAYDGMVIDFKDIKKVVEPIIEKLDHSNLNDILDCNPTAENIAVWIALQILNGTDLGPGLVRVQVSETNDSFATWRS